MEEVMNGILELSGAGSAAIVLVLLARLALGKAPKAYSYALWGIVLFRLLCPAAIPVALPELPQPAPEVTVQQITEAPAPQQPTVSRQPEVREEILDIPVSEVRRPISIQSVLAVFWAAGAGSLLLAGAISNLNFRRRLRESMPIGKNVYIADHIGSAFVIGFLVPKIYLDSSITGKERDYILAHEKTHIRHLDPVTRNLAYLALCLHWFNPLVWLAFHLSARDMEMCCDESVIKKLGPQIRGEYSRSLLSLAAGQHLIPAVAFGEGNTRSRVMNLVNWKQASKRMTALGCTLCILVTALCACQPAPEKEVITSKNDGAFEQNIQATASSEMSEVTVQKNDTFTSADGSVEFSWNLNQALPTQMSPVVEAVPHFFTGEDMHHIADALFDGGTFYDLGLMEQRQFTKEEIRRKIQLYSQFTSEDVWNSLWYSRFLTFSSFKEELAQLNLALETAPEEPVMPVTDWVMKKGKDYLGEGGNSLGDQGNNDRLTLYTVSGSNTYVLSVDTRKTGGYLMNYLNVDLGDGLDNAYGELQGELLWSTEYPTESQVEAAVQKTQSILDRMSMGDFSVAGAGIGEVETGGYFIKVDAVPVIEGIPGLLGHNGILSYDGDLNEESYAPRYSMTTVKFRYNADGVLMQFAMDCPVEVSQVLNPSVPLMPMEQLLEKAQSHLALYDAVALDGVTGNHGFMFSNLSHIDSDSFTMKVELSEIQYGLARIPVPNEDYRFCYTPAIMLKGSMAFYDPVSGNVIGEASGALVTINAVDGTII